MRYSPIQDRSRREPITGYASATRHKILPSPRLLGFFIFVLLFSPRARIPSIGIPLYMVDGLLVLLFFTALWMPAIAWRQLRPIPLLAGIYTIFVCLSEANGLISYGAFAESAYMMGIFCLAIALVYIVPKMLRTPDNLVVMFKGVLISLLLTSIIVILYSFGATRPVVANSIFAWDFLNPGAERYLEILQMTTGEGATRGTSLIGASTITAGFLGTMWPLTFLAARWPGIGRRWQHFAVLVSVLAPLGLLATYGRTAWLIVIVIGIMAGIFGFGGGRRKAFILASFCLLIVYLYGEQSDLFMMDRLTVRTKATINAPLGNPEERERFASYFEPFGHLLENPTWLIFGVGRTGERLVSRGGLETQLFDEMTLATHSAFAMAYYAFGLPSAICQVLLMLSALRLILRRLKDCGKDRQQQLIWQVLLMTWSGLLFWWLSGHAAVGEPRGAMLFFFWFGLLLAFSRLGIARGSLTNGGGPAQAPVAATGLPRWSWQADGPEISQENSYV